MKLTGWMNANIVGALSIGMLSSGAAAQDKPQEPTWDVHLVTASTPRERQIELARSAAPTEVSSKATVYILGPKGYEKAVEGTNGFSCFIWRSFSGITQTSSAPACFDAEGSRTIMVAYMHREELRAEGKSEEEIKDDIVKGYKGGRFKAPGPGFLYMMSNENYVYDSESKESSFVPPHLMFYAPNKTAQDVGYESVSPTMVPFLTTGSGIGAESLLVVLAKKPSQGDSLAIHTSTSLIASAGMFMAHTARAASGRPTMGQPKKMHSRRKKNSDRPCGPTTPTGSAD